ncbi:hypothetical protein J4Q44_G00060620 [Coregonus suidteri]|uniref:Ig-like domain-containing protein n=1 Tax=Coregonus suidteri TaxID=861788 RepID=A0AAN8MCG0_9TELE
MGLLDDHQFVYFDSNTKTLGNTKTLVPTTEWMKENAGEYYWELYTEPLINQYEGFKNLIMFAKKQFNQTQSKGVHTIQNLYGCEWNDETELKYYFHHYGYDGEDFISLDLKTMRWITSIQQADTIKQKWDNNSKDLQYLKWYFTKECIDTLKKYVNFTSSILKRTVPPSVSLLQKTPSSPVTCHATGFYPSGVMVFWQKDGQEQHEDVEYGETLPNLDGTFQKSAHLTMDSEEWENNNYTCVVEHKENIITIKLDQSVIKTNSDKLPEYGFIIIGVVVPVILLALFTIAGFIMWNRMRTGIPNFPEFVTVGLVNGEPISYYDSVIRRETPRQDWMAKSEGSDYWERQTQRSIGSEQTFKANIDNIKPRFNQTGAVCSSSVPHSRAVVSSASLSVSLI